MQFYNQEITSIYIVAHPNNVIDRNIGLATLNTFTFRCLYK